MQVYKNNKVVGFATEQYVDDSLANIPTFPAPYLEDLIPDSYLPDTTGNFVLKGSFFTEQMCLAENLNNTNGILIEGQTINYATFVSDNEILCNVTSGSVEASFSVTLNNGGVAVVFENALLIVLGEVFKPNKEDYIVVDGSATFNDGQISLNSYLPSTQFNLNLNEFIVPLNVDFSFYFTRSVNPLGNVVSMTGENDKFYIRNIDDDSQELYLYMKYEESNHYNYIGVKDRNSSFFSLFPLVNKQSLDYYTNQITKITRINGVVTVQTGGCVPKELGTSPLGSVYFDLRPKYFNYSNIKLVIHP